MQVGDLVRNWHTDETYIITSKDVCGYVVVENRWLIPEEHLEVISESR